MKTSVAAFFASVLFLTGCATQTKEHLSAARAAGVSPALIRKLERWGSLGVEDLIELKRRGVNDAVALRQLDRAGVDSVIGKAEVRKLEAAKVSRDVIVAAVHASERFVLQYTQPGVSLYYYSWGASCDPYYYRFGWPHPHHHLAPPPNPSSAPGGPPPPHP